MPYPGCRDLPVDTDISNNTSRGNIWTGVFGVGDIVPEGYTGIAELKIRAVLSLLNRLLIRARLYTPQ